ncbi:hypothetical protein [Flavobacterium undicola]|uniref:hypothetical protein n=1 Tax=Flavobacterium undicola TaxID=1932779 RepID=UPI0015E201AB|nr:hypothetical protein [Flavobacterium undicola]MBA0884350.1 hypothetical protein [Flavobacterium undicola]
MKRTMTLDLSCSINVKVVFSLGFPYDLLVLSIYFIYLVRKRTDLIDTNEF